MTKPLNQKKNRKTKQKDSKHPVVVSSVVVQLKMKEAADNSGCRDIPIHAEVKFELVW